MSFAAVKAQALKDFGNRQQFTASQKKILMMASLLHPRTKTLPFLPESERAEAFEALAEEAILLASTVHASEALPNLTMPS